MLVLVADEAVCQDAGEQGFTTISRHRHLLAHPRKGPNIAVNELGVDLPQQVQNLEVSAQRRSSIHSRQNLLRDGQLCRIGVTVFFPD